MSGLYSRIYGLRPPLTLYLTLGFVFTFQGQPEHAQYGGNGGGYGGYGYGQGHEAAYGYAPPPQDPNAYYGYAGAGGYGGYQQPPPQQVNRLDVLFYSKSHHFDIVYSLYF